ncbi:MAG: HD domain-containing protein [Anaerolineae bacterium]
MTVSTGVAPTASFGPRMAQVERIAQVAMACSETYPDRPANYILMHGRRVARIALDLASKAELLGELGATIDREVLYAGALFHDVGKAKVDDSVAGGDDSAAGGDEGVAARDLNGNHGAEAHEVVGAERAVRLLTHLFAPDELHQIHDIVLHHNHREPPNDDTMATKIVQDADSLDHVGVVGTWLTVYHIAREGGTLEDLLHYAHSETRTQDREGMRRRLNFEAARRSFDERIAREEAHYRALARGGGLDDR